MEMPVDVLTNRLGRLADDNVLQHNDYTALALDIDTELQEKFIFIPIEEIDAVEIEKTGETRNLLHFKAGGGPETIRARKDDNPFWLYHSAVNALAMLRFLQKEQARKANRPQPGVYQGHDDDGESYFAVIVTEDRRVLVQQSDGGLEDLSADWDRAYERAAGSWNLQRIDTVTGAIAP